MSQQESSLQDEGLVNQFSLNLDSTLLKNVLSRRKEKQIRLMNRFSIYKKIGGAMRDRTADLLRAKQALSQLSYSPLSPSNQTGRFGGSGQIRTADLTLIRGAL